MEVVADVVETFGKVVVDLFVHMAVVVVVHLVVVVVAVVVHLLVVAASSLLVGLPLVFQFLFLVLLYSVLVLFQLLASFFLPFSLTENISKSIFHAK